MFFFFKQKTAYDMRISDWSSDVCSSDLPDCAVITAPVDGAEDVGLGASITWNAVPGASGYRVYIGTIAGGSEVVDRSEERRGGRECGRTCRYRWSAYH